MRPGLTNTEDLRLLLGRQPLLGDVISVLLEVPTSARLGERGGLSGMKRV